MAEEFRLKLRADQSEESHQAFELLSNAGIYFTSVPISGTIGPELDIGPSYNDRLYGLKEIKDWLQKRNRKERG